MGCIQNNQSGIQGLHRTFMSILHVSRMPRPRRESTTFQDLYVSLWNVNLDFTITFIGSTLVIYTYKAEHNTTMVAVELKDESFLISLHWYLALINSLLQHWQGLEDTDTRLDIEHRAHLSNDIYSQSTQIYILILTQYDTEMQPHSRWVNTSIMQQSSTLTTRGNNNVQLEQWQWKTVTMS